MDSKTDSPAAEYDKRFLEGLQAHLDAVPFIDRDYDIEFRRMEARGASLHSSPSVKLMSMLANFLGRK